MREGLGTIPPEILAWLRAPTCDPDAAQIELGGPWLGIIGANGETELDMAPPYDLEILARQSSPAYAQANLTTRVLPHSVVI